MLERRRLVFRGGNSRGSENQTIVELAVQKALTLIAWSQIMVELKNHQPLKGIVQLLVIQTFWIKNPYTKI